MSKIELENNSSSHETIEEHLSPANDPGQRVVSQQTNRPINNPGKKLRTIILVAASLIIIALIIGVIHYLILPEAKSPSAINTNSVASSSKDHLISTQVDGVNIKYLTIPLAVIPSSDKWSCDVPYSNCSTPTSNISTSSGHYVASNNIGVTYDGNLVYKGSNVVGQVISQNGLHYAFITQTANYNEIYIDGKLTQYKVKVGNEVPLTLDALSNDGKSVAYFDDDSGDYYLNSSVLKNVESIQFSYDLQTYISSVTNDNNMQISLNGNQIAVYPEDDIEDLSLSGNGLHYAYVVSDDSTFSDLYVDGKEIGQIPVDGINLFGITNNGNYYFLNGDSNALQIDGKLFTLPSNIPNDYSTTPQGGEPYQLTVNDDASQYFFYINNYYLLTGKKINTSGNVFGADFENNILYIYKFNKSFSS